MEGEYIPSLKYLVLIFVEKLYKMKPFRGQRCITTAMWFVSRQNLNPIQHIYSISRTCIAKEECLFYLVENNWNCHPLCPVHHVACNITYSPRSPKEPLRL